MISVSMIVKNEESCLERCLKSVKYFDEIVVVDTGSTDKTLEIARKYTDKIYNFEWCDDFAKARNFANSKCTGDWILSIDADHELLSTKEEVEAETERLKDHDIVFVRYASHLREVLYKNKEDVYWVGAVHENLNKPATATSTIKKKIGYSKAHELDPDRNLRILLKSEKTRRVMFYLGREYFEKRQYDESIKWMTEYLKEAVWSQEIAEAYITIAKCYWQTNRGSLARDACLKAIGTNPDFKEALNLMSTMTFEPLKTKWKKLADIATNKDVLFIR